MSSPPSISASDSPGEPLDDLRAYYVQPAVRQRIIEFLGGHTLAHATCRYIAADDATAARREPRAVSELPACLDENLDISRALWDSDALIAHLDIEYVNFDHPAEAYQNPERAFELQRPVEEATRVALGEMGIAPLQVLSGRGHHFVWRVARESEAFGKLAGIGRVNPTLLANNSRPHPPAGECVSPEMGSAFAGLGLVMEFLAHRIKKLAAPHCAIPVEFTAVEVGPRLSDREMISIDLSEYGDPLHTRTLRVPFSIYHKPSQERWLIGEEVASKLPKTTFVPLVRIGVRDALEMRHDMRRTAAFAAEVSTFIPGQEEGTERLLAEYAASSLGQCHRWFYSQEQHPPDMWPETYDRTSMEVLPKCARKMLECPNDLLLHPASMRLVTRVFLALGWHPRHIAGLICSKFARDHAWGGQWLECDPAARADFYTRIFTGLFATGHDDLLDFNCQSSKEERICPVADCPHNLEVFRQSALARRHYDKLAHRPFHRLFLPKTDS